jgi:hypothetical protein
VPLSISLEAEVDSYLALPASFEEDLIAYWQVCGSVSGV